MSDGRGSSRVSSARDFCFRVLGGIEGESNDLCISSKRQAQSVSDPADPADHPIFRSLDLPI
ncbi:MAG TPA: hypothetical protein VFL42_05350, partial [Terriglobales bacterium]|nr:hypothetical protein [Terriglobales bacterium]